MAPALDFERFGRTRSFAALDGVRGLMVLWVVLYHCAPSQLGLQLVRRHADFAVDVFFALSGFLITTLLLREAPAPLGVQLGRFYVRRALRIFPLYYAGILLYLVAVRVFGRPEAVAEYREMLPALLFYWADWRLAFAPELEPPFVQAWSLAVEEKFYLLWPLVVLLRPRAIVPVAVAGIVATVVWRDLELARGASEQRLYYSFDLRLDAILWGALLAGLARRRGAFEWLRRAAAPPVFWATCALFVALTQGAANSVAWRYVAVPIVATVLLTGLLVRPDMPGTGLLRTRLLQHIGKVSYCIYILHPLCLQLAQRLCGGSGGAPVDGLFEFLIGAPLSIAIATASYRWFEAPILRLKDRFRGAPAVQPAPAGMATGRPARAAAAVDEDRLVGAGRGAGGDRSDG